MSVDNPLSLLESAATKVRDPVSGSSVWLAGMVQKPRMEDGKLRFDLVFKKEHTRDDRRAIEQAVIANLRGTGYSGDVLPFPRLEGSVPGERPAAGQATHSHGHGPARGKDPVPGMSGPGVQPHGGPIAKKPIGAKRLIAVASGKGGVGKSTVATNLAVALARKGFVTGLLDADVYGPSLQKMMNATQRPMVTSDNKIVPISCYGVRCLSMGLLVPEEEAMIWRGPMVMGVLRQLLQDAAWDVDYLVVDLPPGTGDVHLTLIQGTTIHGAIIVTTPQDVALADAIRGITMFRKLDVPLLGVVENMAFYELPDGTRDYVFGEGGGRRVAERYGTELLTELPLRTALRRSGDEGLPAALGDDATAKAFADLADKVVAKLPVT